MSVNAILEQQNALINTIRQATAFLDAVGTGDLQAALADLERARREAQARLDAAADAARAAFASLAGHATQTAATLAADLGLAGVSKTQHPAPVAGIPATDSPEPGKDGEEVTLTSEDVIDPEPIAPTPAPEPTVVVTATADGQNDRPAEVAVSSAANGHAQDTHQTLTQAPPAPGGRRPRKGRERGA